MRSRMPGSAVVLCLLAGFGCNEAPPEEKTPVAAAPAAEQPVQWQRVDEGQLDEAQAARRRHALAARDALMQKLKGRLMEVVSKDGLAAAISVCKEDAPKLAAEVAEENDLKIGRTSFRLRNPSNQPPEWAETLVAEKVDKPVYLASDERLAAFLPITTGPLCVNCHGTTDGISPNVLNALEEQYPDDRATGFEEGDLRGWFWVEVGAP